jgi:hypothetical protein
VLKHGKTNSKINGHLIVGREIFLLVQKNKVRWRQDGISHQNLEDDTWSSTPKTI